MTIRLKYISSRLAMLAAALLTVSCVMNDPEEIVSDQGQVNVQVASRSNAAADQDDMVYTVRIMAFDPSDGGCRFNTLFSTEWNENVTLTLKAKTYDFVFLANEPTGTMRDELQAITHRTHLDGIAYPASLFASDLPIPMMQTVEGVQVLSNNGGVLIPGQSNAVTLWQLALRRLGVRLDVNLTAKEAINSDFRGVRLTNIPDKVPLTSGYTGTITRNGTREFTVSSDPGYFEDFTPSDATLVWGKRVKRIIVPSNEFTPATNASQAVNFTILLHDQYNPSSTIGVNESASDYTLPRNTHLTCTGEVRMPLQLNITPSDWTLTYIDWTVPTTRILNVSHNDLSLTPMNAVRVTFTSNMPVVYVAKSMRRASDNAEVVTNNIFGWITGASWQSTYQPSLDRFKYSYDYDSSSGTGYMDILLQDIDLVDDTYTMTVMAGPTMDPDQCIKKEIKVKVNITFKRYYWPFERAVGTFHRDNERGERLIIGGRYWTQEWTAEVVQGADWIALSRTPSYDPNVGTDNPGDPEQYPVVDEKDASNKVNGVGTIYLRVGIKNDNPTAGTAPRYGLIKITTLLDNDEQLIYVRQGESPDYLMRPTDLPEAGLLAGQQRPVARRLSPYNLTAAAFKNLSHASNNSNYVTVGLRGGDFVQYPSQVGAFFQWAIINAENASQRYRAFNPVKGGSTGYGSDFSGDGKVSTWDAVNGTNETCPSGWYRPTDGYTNGPSANIALAELLTSEVRQSLFLNPPKGNGLSNIPTENAYVYEGTMNWVVGFYADGFTDRRPIKVAPGSDVRTQLTVVSGQNTLAAAEGTLFFNPANNASIFLPMTGRLYPVENNMGQLQFMGSGGYYWSSSVTPVHGTLPSFAWGYVTSGTIYTKTLGVRPDAAHAIRCVRRD